MAIIAMTPQELMATMKKERQTQLGELVASMRQQDLPRSTDIAKSIVSLAKSQKIELLVMGTVCRTGVTGFLIGNTAEKVLNKVNCSVLTVKPEGFVTPVTL